MTCPDCDQPMTGVEYRDTTEDYDGISEFECPGCGLRIGRWSKRRLTPQELEGRWGRSPRSARIVPGRSE
jgi:hypothetical protein